MSWPSLPKWLQGLIIQMDLRKRTFGCLAYRDDIEPGLHLNVQLGQDGVLDVHAYPFGSCRGFAFWLYFLRFSQPASDHWRWAFLLQWPT